MEQPAPPAQPAPKRPMSSGTKFGIGCAVAAVVVILLVCGGVVAVVIWGVGKLNAFAEEYVDQGYVHVSGQQIRVDEEITEPTVFTGQMLDVTADSNASIAFMGQIAEIHGTINGDIDFFGQELTIHEGAVVTGDVDGQGQVVNILGEVRGQVKGSWQSRSPGQDSKEAESTDGEAVSEPEDGVEVEQ